MKKYKIGYTTGVFDLFHIGHLNILRNAKEQCEFLVVGVSTDELVIEYKNRIPIIPFQERKAIIEAIKYVDLVVPQTNMDKISACKDFNVDVVFHGDDWKGSALYTEIEKMLHDSDVDMVFLPHTEGTSSTILSQILISALEKQK